MLQENLKRFRKEKGFSQEQLAVRLHIVRQTVSKWEQGLSVPDAEMLVRVSGCWRCGLSGRFAQTAGEEPPDSTLDSIARELQKLNELLASQAAAQAERRKKLLAVLVPAAAALLAILFLAAVYPQWNRLFTISGRTFTTGPTGNNGGCKMKNDGWKCCAFLHSK